MERGDGWRSSAFFSFLPSQGGWRSDPDSCRFFAHVEKTIASRPAEAALGGVPSVQNKIRAFLNVKYLRNGQWTEPSLEVRPFLSFDVKGEQDHADALHA